LLLLAGLVHRAAVAGLVERFGPRCDTTRVDDCRGGQRTRWGKRDLYAATRAKLFGVVLRILRRQDLAEEVIQEAYVRIWNSAGQFNPGQSSPITWMASIARNRAIDVVRKRGEASIEEEPAAMEVAADSPDPLARREMGEELKRLLECIGRLEPDRQKLVLLAYYNGWSREQLAEKFEAPVNTVKTWLRRSVMDIRECLGL
jgi:RNA polymerase sigma-70 factor, ECF subfamily